MKAITHLMEGRTKISLEDFPGKPTVPLPIRYDGSERNTFQEHFVITRILASLTPKGQRNESHDVSLLKSTLNERRSCLMEFSKSLSSQLTLNLCLFVPFIRFSVSNEFVMRMHRKSMNKKQNPIIYYTS